MQVLNLRKLQRKFAWMVSEEPRNRNWNGGPKNRYINVFVVFFRASQNGKRPTAKATAGIEHAYEKSYRAKIYSKLDNRLVRQKSRIFRPAKMFISRLLPHGPSLPDRGILSKIQSHTIVGLHPKFLVTTCHPGAIFRSTIRSLRKKFSAIFAFFPIVRKRPMFATAGGIFMKIRSQLGASVPYLLPHSPPWYRPQGRRYKFFPKVLLFKNKQKTRYFHMEIKFNEIGKLPISA